MSYFFIVWERLAFWSVKEACFLCREETETQKQNAENKTFSEIILLKNINKVLSEMKVN